MNILSHYKKVFFNFFCEGTHIFSHQCIIFLLIPIVVLITPHISHAANVFDSIKLFVSDRAKQISTITQEIIQFESIVSRTKEKRKTLESELNILKASERKINNELKETEASAKRSEEIVSRLTKEIEIAENKITSSQSGLRRSVQAIQSFGKTPILLTLLEHSSLSEYWKSNDAIGQLQIGLSSSIKAYSDQKQELERTMGEHIHEKERLLKIEKDIEIKKDSLLVTKQEQARLIAETKSDEKNYQKMLQDKKKLKEQFEKEIQDIESELTKTLAFSSKDIPKASLIPDGVFFWPLKQFILTQHFGYTAFAASGAYKGKGHNGIDLGVPVGTPVFSIGNGTVVGSGDTDLYCPKAAYGKWVAVEHSNGLMSIYAHLSKISVDSGAQVSNNTVIGLSGSTGYSIGPHLHLSLVATKGSQIKVINARSCGGALMPLVASNAYLNPLNYLPKK